MKGKPKFKVGQLVIYEGSHGRRSFHKIYKIDLDGTLYENCGHYITKLPSSVRPLTAREKGISR